MFICFFQLIQASGHEIAIWNVFICVCCCFCDDYGEFLDNTWVFRLLMYSRVTECSSPFFVLFCFVFVFFSSCHIYIELYTLYA